jgi:hypothetical protein
MVAVVRTKRLWRDELSDPAGGVERHAGERGGKVAKREAAAGQLHHVHIDAKHRLAVAVDLHVGHARHGQKPVLDIVGDDLGEVLRRAGRRGDGKAQDGVSVGVGLDDARVIGIVGERVADAGDCVAQVGRSHVQIDGGAKLDGDAAGAEAG